MRSMAQMKFNKPMVIVFVCLFMLTSAHAQQRGTPVEAKKLVEKAVAYVKANGEDKALKEFSKPRGQFVEEEEYLFGYDLNEVMKDDLYIFAYDLKGVLMANPVAPKLVGKNLYNVPDSRGKLFRKEIVDLANSRGSGWVDYAYINPVTKQEETKITYFQKVDNLIICCGAYLP